MGGETIESGFHHIEPVAPADEGPWIDSQDMRLVHQIGKGRHGEAWLATLHNATEDFDEFHEVAVKIIPEALVRDEPALMRQFEELYHLTKNVEGVCWPRGLCKQATQKSGQQHICIVTKLYDLSLADALSRHPDRKLPLGDVIRYGEGICRSVLLLHKRGVLSLSLRPSNFLVDDHDAVVVAHFNLPLLLLGSTELPAEPDLSSAGLARYGSWYSEPNYLAPEAWSPFARGPLTEASDAWAFACSMIELLTGSTPWAGKSSLEIYRAVVLRQEAPSLPPGLPPAVHRALSQCLQHDFRRRPSFQTLLKAFTRPHSSLTEGEWVRYVGSEREELVGRVGVLRTVSPDGDTALVAFPGCGEGTDNLTAVAGAQRALEVLEEPLALGDIVRVARSVTNPRFGWKGASMDSCGPIVGIRPLDGTLWIKHPECQDLWQADPVDVERICGSFTVGDWVVLGAEQATAGEAASSTGAGPSQHSRIGVVHSIGEAGSLRVAFCGRSRLWEGRPSELEGTTPAVLFKVGQFVRVKEGVSTLRFAWPLHQLVRGPEVLRKATARIVAILPNGTLCLRFPGRIRPIEAMVDPSEVEVVRFQDRRGLVQKLHHLEAMHWSVRPALGLVGLLLALRLGTCVAGFALRPVVGFVTGGKKRDQEEEAYSSEHMEMEMPGDRPGKWAIPNFLGAGLN